MPRTPVRGYERRGPHGTTISVGHHKRRGATPGAAWRSIRRGWKHNRKGNYGRFIGWTVLGGLTFATWATFQGASRFLLMTALVAGGLSIALSRASGKETAS